MLTDIAVDRVTDYTPQIIEALARDMGRSAYETQLVEISFVKNDLIYVQKNLKKWAKEETGETNFLFSFMNPKIRKDPLGTVLVIGAFNLPLQLTLTPVVGAIAAGNTVIVKPSEVPSHTAAVMQAIIESSLDPGCYKVVQGSVPETQALLAERFDKICFTGSDRVGRIVASSAAPKLTPVLLELGGRNPAIVTRNADARLAARRLTWGKAINSGQICLSENAILAEKPIVPALVEEFRKAFKEFWPEGPLKSPDWPGLVNEATFNRVKSILSDSNGTILIGGQTDAASRKIEPTLVEINDPTDSVCAVETFGPIITILPVDSVDAAISFANSFDATPLALYAFGNSAECEHILSSTRSGGASINDTFMHGSIGTLPFGGVGTSGSGNYRGRASFEAFTHRRTVTTTPWWVESGLAVRYPPFAGKMGFMLAAGEDSPGFDRAGRTKGLLSWILYVLTLGGGANKRGAVRSSAAVLG